MGLPAGQRAALIIIYALPALLLIILSVAVPGSISPEPWRHIAMHSAVETFGGFAAITLGTILSFYRKDNRSVSRSKWVSSGLLAMGLLDVFHASVEPGNSFVWLRSAAQLAGGALFFLVLFESGGSKRSSAMLAPLAAISAAILGALSAVFPEALPAMAIEGRFTLAASAMNIAGGLLFMAAALGFFAGYLRSREKADLFFAIISGIFGLVGLLFPFSKPWDPTWWYWHFLRLIAITLVLFYMIAIFRRFISMVNSSIETISRSSADMAATVAQNEKTASSQAAMVSETSATVSELGVSARKTAEQATSATDTARKASVATDEGQSAVKEAIEGMGDLKDTVSSVAESAFRLGDRISHVGTITEMIKDLASQTNMLALNAAVEAVRAGVHGKGFAVLASEVRKLADQSKRSAEDARAIVSEIQKAANLTIMVTEEGTKTVARVTSLAGQVGNIFDNLSQASGAVYDNAQQVLLNARQQSAAIGQVVEAVNSINAGSKETAAGITQTRAGIQALNKTAEDLKAMA